ncbi:SIS domain-containing protein [Streptomyces hygroscopicus]|nr:SIS domain-containing protein [Streptomyces hygroscopicus]
MRAAHAHCQALQDALVSLREHGLEQVAQWGRHLAATLPVGGRLLAAGNGGSAAQAQHLTAELVGRYQRERPAYSAIALHADTSSLTAIGNDYGFEELYARQVAAHGRPGDVLLLMSTSGRSPNLLAAADTGRAAGLRVWAMTGPRPNPLAFRADEALCIGSGSTATVQESHLVALHLLCETFDHESRASEDTPLDGAGVGDGALDDGALDGAVDGALDGAVDGAVDAPPAGPAVPVAGPAVPVAGPAVPVAGPVVPVDGAAVPYPYPSPSRSQAAPTSPSTDRPVDRPPPDHPPPDRPFP